MSHRFYRTTMPYRFLFDTLGRGSPAQVAVAFGLRKLYSLIGFTLVGFVLDRALAPRAHAVATAAIAVAAFSAVIEVTQTSRGATERVAVHIFDVACGALGGALGAVLARRLR